MEIVDELKKSYRDIMDAVENLTTEEMSREKTIGEWSVRDVILHIAMWEGEVVKMLAIWRAGHEVDWSYAKHYLKFNDFWLEITKHLSVEKIMKMFDFTHVALLADISAIPGEVWAERGGLPKWIYDITVGHNNEHIPKLQDYKTSLGK
jgi:hypothetical protein